MSVYGFSHEQEALRTLARRTAIEELAPRAEQLDREGRYPIENIHHLAEQGLMGLLVPTEFGGLGGDVLSFVLVSEELARICPSTAMVWGMHTNQYVCLVEHGTEQQKDKWLPRIAAGELICASGTTEPETGNNATYCVSTLQREGDVLFLAGSSLS